MMEDSPGRGTEAFRKAMVEAGFDPDSPEDTEAFEKGLREFGAKLREEQRPRGEWKPVGVEEKDAQGKDAQGRAAQAPVSSGMPRAFQETGGYASPSDQRETEQYTQQAQDETRAKERERQAEEDRKDAERREAERREANARYGKGGLGALVPDELRNDEKPPEEKRTADEIRAEEDRRKAEDERKAEEKRRADEERRQRMGAYAQRVWGHVPGAAAGGIAAAGAALDVVGEMAGGVERLFDAVMTGNPVSVTSALLAEAMTFGDAQSAAMDELHRMHGLVAGADAKRVRDTARGRAMAAKQKAMEDAWRTAEADIHREVANLGGGPGADLTQLGPAQLTSFMNWLEPELAAARTTSRDPTQPEPVRRAARARATRLSDMRAGVRARRGEVAEAEDQANRQAHTARVQGAPAPVQMIYSALGDGAHRMPYVPVDVDGTTYEVPVGGKGLAEAERRLRQQMSSPNNMNDPQTMQDLKDAVAMVGRWRDQVKPPQSRAAPTWDLKGGVGGMYSALLPRVAMGPDGMPADLSGTRRGLRAVDTALRDTGLSDSDRAAWTAVSDSLNDHARFLEDREAAMRARMTFDTVTGVSGRSTGTWAMAARDAEAAMRAIGGDDLDLSEIPVALTQDPDFVRAYNRWANNTNALTVNRLLRDIGRYGRDRWTPEDLANISLMLTSLQTDAAKGRTAQDGYSDAWKGPVSDDRLYTFAAFLDDLVGPDGRRDFARARRMLGEMELKGVADQDALHAMEAIVGMYTDYRAGVTDLDALITDEGRRALEAFKADYPEVWDTIAPRRSSGRRSGAGAGGMRVVDPGQVRHSDAMMAQWEAKYENIADSLADNRDIVGSSPDKVQALYDFIYGPQGVLMPLKQLSQIQDPDGEWDFVERAKDSYSDWSIIGEAVRTYMDPKASVEDRGAAYDTLRETYEQGENIDLGLEDPRQTGDSDIPPIEVPKRDISSLTEADFDDDIPEDEVRDMMSLVDISSPEKTAISIIRLSGYLKPDAWRAMAEGFLDDNLIQESAGIADKLGGYHMADGRLGDAVEYMYLANLLDPKAGARFTRILTDNGATVDDLKVMGDALKGVAPSNEKGKPILRDPDFLAKVRSGEVLDAIQDKVPESIAAILRTRTPRKRAEADSDTPPEETDEEVPPEETVSDVDLGPDAEGKIKREDLRDDLTQEEWDDFVAKGHLAGLSMEDPHADAWRKAMWALKDLVNDKSRVNLEWSTLWGGATVGPGFTNDYLTWLSRGEDPKRTMLRNYMRSVASGNADQDTDRIMTAHLMRDLEMDEDEALAVMDTIKGRLRTEQGLNEGEVFVGKVSQDLKNRMTDGSLLKEMFPDGIGRYSTDFLNRPQPSVGPDVDLKVEEGGLIRREFLNLDVTQEEWDELVTAGVIEALDSEDPDEVAWALECLDDYFNDEGWYELGSYALRNCISVDDWFADGYLARRLQGPNPQKIMPWAYLAAVATDNVDSDASRIMMRCLKGRMGLDEGAAGEVLWRLNEAGKALRAESLSPKELQSRIWNPDAMRELFPYGIGRYSAEELFDPMAHEARKRRDEYWRMWNDATSEKWHENATSSIRNRRSVLEKLGFVKGTALNQLLGRGNEIKTRHFGPRDPSRDDILMSLSDDMFAMAMEPDDVDYVKVAKDVLSLFGRGPVKILDPHLGSALKEVLGETGYAPVLDRALPHLAKVKGAGTEGELSEFLRVMENGLGLPRRSLEITYNGATATSEAARAALGPEGKEEGKPLRKLSEIVDQDFFDTMKILYYMERDIDRTDKDDDHDRFGIWANTLGHIMFDLDNNLPDVDEDTPFVAGKETWDNVYHLGLILRNSRDRSWDYVPENLRDYHTGSMDIIMSDLYDAYKPLGPMMIARVRGEGDGDPKVLQEFLDRAYEYYNILGDLAGTGYEGDEEQEEEYEEADQDQDQDQDQVPPEAPPENTVQTSHEEGRRRIMELSQMVLDEINAMRAREEERREQERQEQERADWGKLSTEDYLRGVLAGEDRDGINRLTREFREGRPEAKAAVGFLIDLGIANGTRDLKGERSFRLKEGWKQDVMNILGGGDQKPPETPPEVTETETETEESGGPAPPGGALENHDERLRMLYGDVDRELDKNTLLRARIDVDKMYSEIRNVLGWMELKYKEYDRETKMHRIKGRGPDDDRTISRDQRSDIALEVAQRAIAEYGRNHNRINYNIDLPPQKVQDAVYRMAREHVDNMVEEPDRLVYEEYTGDGSELTGRNPLDIPKLGLSKEEELNLDDDEWEDAMYEWTEKLRRNRDGYLRAPFEKEQTGWAKELVDMIHARFGRFEDASTDESRAMYRKKIMEDKQTLYDLNRMMVESEGDPDLPIRYRGRTTSINTERAAWLMGRELAEGQDLGGFSDAEYIMNIFQSNPELDPTRIAIQLDNEDKDMYETFSVREKIMNSMIDGLSGRFKGNATLKDMHRYVRDMTISYTNMARKGLSMSKSASEAFIRTLRYIPDDPVAQFIATMDGEPLERVERFMKSVDPRTVERPILRELMERYRFI